MSTPHLISHRTLDRASFFAIAGIIFSIIFFRLGTPFITILFGYLLLHYLGKVLPKKVAILTFIVLVLILFSLFVNFTREAVVALPKAIEKAMPTLNILLKDVNEFLKHIGFTPFFEDFEGLKSSFGALNDEVMVVARFAKVFSLEFVYVIIALVATCGIFSTKEIDLGTDSYAIRNNLYSGFTSKLATRFRNFFISFHTIMGAQVAISAVNTLFTGLFVVSLSVFGAPMPYAFVIIVVTFLCGLLPIVGNLISNTIIFCIGLTQSIQLGVISLAYLIVLHKFEYFLNSRIIGGRIKNPMWLTLLSLLVGERLAGVPGMILAPVVLNYCKLEGASIAVATPSDGEPK
jgi:predicted PurR-regulated permease PerM